MDIRELFTAVRRWWGLSATVLLLTVGAGTGLFALHGPSYTAVSNVVLVPPPATVTDASRGSAYAPPNPLLYLGGLTQSRDLVLEALGSTGVQDRFATSFPGSTLEATASLTSSGPVVVLTVTSGSPTSAISAMTFAGQQVPSVLDDLQSKLRIAGADRISSMVLTADTTAQVNHKSQLQLAILAAVGVLVLGVVGIGIFDHLARNPRRSNPPMPQGQPRSPEASEGRRFADRRVGNVTAASRTADGVAEPAPAPR